MKRSSRSIGKRNAITLIEVVVALVLLATLVAGMVTAYSAHHRQALLALRRQDAVQAADRLLAQWYSSADPQVPRNRQGILQGSPTYLWRTEIVHQNQIESLPVEVVRLQVFPATTNTFVTNSTAANPSAANATLIDEAGESRRNSKPLAQVDVILPIPEGRP